MPRIIHVHPTKCCENYKLGAMLGSTGKVYRAVDMETKEHVIVMFSDSEEWMEREANHLKLLQSSNVVPTFKKIDSAMSRHCIITSLEGHDLQMIVDQSPGNRLSVHNLKAFMIHGLNALREFHKMNFVHRDIRLDNFVIGVSPNKAPLLLVDVVNAQQFDRAKKEFQQYQPTLFTKQLCDELPPILRDGKWTCGCDLFQFGLVLLKAAGYHQQSDRPAKDIEVRQWRDEHQFMIEFFVQVLIASNSPDGFVNYDGLLNVLERLEGYDPNTRFQY